MKINHSCNQKKRKVSIERKIDFQKEFAKKINKICEDEKENEKSYYFIHQEKKKIKKINNDQIIDKFKKKFFISKKNLETIRKTRVKMKAKAQKSLLKIVPKKSNLNI